MSATSCKARETAGNVPRACALAASWSSSSGTQPPMPRSGRRAVAQGSTSRWARVSGSSSPLAWARASGRSAAISPGCRPRRTRCRVIQGQGQTLDPGPLGHEAEVDGEHRGFAAEEHVVIEEVAVGPAAAAWGCQPLIRCVPARVPTSTWSGPVRFANSAVWPAAETCTSASRAWMRPGIGSPWPAWQVPPHANSVMTARRGQPHVGSDADGGLSFV